MKTLFLIVSVMFVMFFAVTEKAYAQKTKAVKIIEGTISGFDCGDNCYLTITDKKGKKHNALCSKSACSAWFEKQSMPKRFIGKRVKVTIGKGKQYDGGGNLMGTMDEFIKVQFR